MAPTRYTLDLHGFFLLQHGKTVKPIDNIQSRILLRIKDRRLLFLASAIATILLAALFVTQQYGTVAVNAMERSEYGDLYMQIRNDEACAIFPFVVSTGFTTTIHDTTTGKTWREPKLRRYYVWIGLPIRIPEWHRQNEAC